MEKKYLIDELKKNGFRITKQREMLLDIILENNCSCIKEIYYKAQKKDKNIGFATVYRMVNMLENMGFINRKNMYRIACSETCKAAQGCLIEFDDDSKLELSGTDWNKVIYEGLKGLQLLDNRNIRSILSIPVKENDFMNKNLIITILLPFLGTTLGSACVFIMRNELKVNTRKILAGFAAGVMVAASIWSLLIPAIEQSEKMGKLSFIPAFAGFWIGTLFLLLLDKVVPHTHIDSTEKQQSLSLPLPYTIFRRVWQ